MPTPAKQRTAIVYCRTSTAQQAEGETIAGQIERDRRLVERYDVRLIKYGNGWPTDPLVAEARIKLGQPVIQPNSGWIIDDGISGSMLDGREFGRFIAELRARKVKVDHVIVFNLARISRLDKSSGDMERMIRSHEHNAMIKAVFIGANVTVLDEEGENDPKTTIYDLKTAISVGQYNEIQKNTTAGKQRLCAAGAWPKGGNAPYGLRRAFVNGVDRKAGFKLVPSDDTAPGEPTRDPEAARNLRTVFGWYTETGGAWTDKDGGEHERGGVTYAALRATEAGFRPPKAGPKRKGPAPTDKPKGPRDKSAWWPSSVVALVRVARMYALGEQTLSFGGEPHTVKFKPIINGKLYEAVSRRAKQRTLKHRTDFLTTGFVDCQCGAHVHARSCYAGRQHYIRCGNACGVGGIHEDKFSAVLWSAVVLRLFQIRQHEHTNGHDADNGEAALKDARAKLATVNAEIAKLLDAYLTAGTDKDAYRTKNEALNDRKAAAQAEVDGILRDREARAQKKATLDSVESRVGALLDELAETRTAFQPPLDRKRQILAEVLAAGGKVIVGWPKSNPQVATITLPAFGSLPARTVRTDASAAELTGGGVIIHDAGDLDEMRDMLGGPGDPEAKRVRVGDVFANVRRLYNGRRWFGLQAPDGRFIPVAPVKAKDPVVPKRGRPRKASATV